MSETILKGRISNSEEEVEYVWHSSNNACEKCLELKGKIFDSIDEIPDLPHPNCKCWVEDRKKEEKFNPKEDEQCDCWDKVENLLNQADEAQGDANSSKEELVEYKKQIENEISNFNEKIKKVDDLKNELANASGSITGAASFIDNYPSKSYSELYQTGYEAIDFIEAGFKVYDIFQKNLEQSISETGKRDKYYHSKANCESAELGALEAMFAVVFSIGKELYDMVLKVGIRHQNFIKVVKDCLQDLEADFMGLMKAKEEGQCRVKVLEVEEYFKNKKP